MYVSVCGAAIQLHLQCTYATYMLSPIDKRVVASLTPRDKPYEVRGEKVKGFLLRVQPSGKPTYYCEYDRGKRFKIGSTEVLTPDQARNLTLGILSDYRHGVSDTAKKKLGGGGEEKYYRLCSNGIPLHLHCTKHSFALTLH